MIYFKLINIFLLYITLSYCYNQNNNNNNIQNNNNNCLEVTIQDSFGDGWEDGTYLYYTYDDNNNLNMTNSLTLSNCSYSTFTTCLKPQDTSHYIHLTLKSILDGVEFTPAFYWEMQYTVKLYDDNGDLTHQYYGGFNTSMVFKYDEINNYQLEWWENLWTDPEEANICGTDEFSFSDTCSQFTVTTNLFNSTNSGNYENAGWFISPADNTADLVDYGIPWSGAVYSNSSSSDCSICLESGNYLFRVTGALYALEEEISWSFCGVEGKGQIEMSFTVTNSICEPTLIRTLSMICESEVIETSEPTFSPTSVPSSSPTLSPTPLPSTNPTFVPSSLPSLQPTPLPSTNPTLSPTFTPTVVPSYRPSFNPTSIYDTLKVTERTSACYSDCSYPGMTIPPAEWSEEEYCAFYSTTTCSVSGISGYSCVPSCLADCSDVFCDSMSTLVYSCDPNVRATYRNKTVVESACLESFSSNAQTKTLMSFTTDSTFDGVSPTEMQNDPVAQQAAIVAMSLSVSGVPADQITIESISGSDNRRLDFSLSLSKSNLKGSYSNNNKNNINLEAAQAILTYKITATLESLGFTADSYELAYSQLTNQISTSVASGQFQQNLKAAGQTAGVSTFTNAEVTKIPTYSSPEVVLLITAPPTGQPTSQPTRHKSKSSEDDDNVGAIAGGVVGGFFGLLLIIGIIYYVYKDRQRHELESKFLEHNSNTQKKSEPSVPTTTDPYANNNPLQNDDVQVSFAYDNNNETDLSGARSSTGYQRPSQIVTQGTAKKDARDADVFL